MRILICACMVLGLTLSAQGILIESEPNNSIATANSIVVGSRAWDDLGVFSLGGTAGDVDWFLMVLAVDDQLSAEAGPVQPMFTNPDMRLGIFDFAGNLLAADVNSPNPGAQSNLVYTVSAAGNYYLAVTGGTDVNFVGQHAQAGPYILSLSVITVPEPATVALLTLAGLTCVRRVRRRS